MNNSKIDKYGAKLNRNLMIKQKKNSDLLSLLRVNTKEKKSNMIDINVYFSIENVDSDEEIDKKYGLKSLKFSKKEIKKIKEQMKLERFKGLSTKKVKEKLEK